MCFPGRGGEFLTVFDGKFWFLSLIKGSTRKKEPLVSSLSEKSFQLLSFKILREIIEKIEKSFHKFNFGGVIEGFWKQFSLKASSWNEFSQNFPFLTSNMDWTCAKKRKRITKKAYLMKFFSIKIEKRWRRCLCWKRFATLLIKETQGNRTLPNLNQSTLKNFLLKLLKNKKLNNLAWKNLQKKYLSKIVLQEENFLKMEIEMTTFWVAKYKKGKENIFVIINYCDSWCLMN